MILRGELLVGYFGAEESRTLRSGFLRAAERFPERPALQIADATLSYRDLLHRASQLAATLDQAAAGEGPPLTAVYGHRSFAAFAGVLGALMRGHGYVPLNPAFPPERTRAMLERAGCRQVVVDEDAAATLDALLDGLDTSLTFILPEREDVAELAARWPRQRFLGRKMLRPVNGWRPAFADPDQLAYLLFTSGSTGVPKGVMVAHRNVLHFIDAMVARYGVTERDRFSHTFDLTFDLSVFDMFVAWEAGACLCCATQKQKLLPGKYVKDSGLTVWFSVPSTAILMSRLRMLKPSQYPDLRLSLFCGEALPMEVVQAWERAAPHSVIENLYGPTELTIACTLYRWDPGQSPAACEQGLVPIGTPYPEMHALVVDERLEEVDPGQPGELLMTGPQLSLGYWRDPKKTAASFVRPPGRDEVYYRTGDRVRRPASEHGPLVYLGRMDNQIKVQGYRVELGEVEAALRQEAGVDTAVAIGWPVTSSGAEGIVGFVVGGAVDVERVLAGIRARLPPYMHVRDLRILNEFPLNANGKVDRKALRRVLEASA